MVATTRSPPPVPTAPPRRSFTLEPPVPSRSHGGRRHSVAVGETAPSAEDASHEEQSSMGKLTSPRTLKEYEDELLLGPSKPNAERPRALERAKRAGSTMDDATNTLPRKLQLTRRQSKATAKDEPQYDLEIIGPAHAGVEAAIADALQGFHAHIGPVSVDDGTGGVYYLRSKAQRIVAVFKPADEEPFAVNNPKEHRPPRRDDDADGGNNSGHGGGADASRQPELRGIRGGISPGLSAIREVAAFLLDHDHRAGVPPTALVVAQHPAFFVRGHATGPSTTTTTTQRKVGSMQLYVPHECTADDVSESLLPVERVHAMAILDIRVANQDRHGGNVLVAAAPRRYDLVPIDHGACLPRVSRLDETSFLWLDWPQAKLPFSAETVAFIASLDAVHEAERVASQLPAPHALEADALLTLAVCTSLLQVCVLDFGMTAHGIASLMCREDPSEPSVLEQLVARSLIAPTTHWPSWETSHATRLLQVFREHLTTFLSEYLTQ